MKPWAEKLYKSGAWQETSREYIASVGGLCERCSTPALPVVAEMCHHKIWLTPGNINDPRITMGWDNLEALCLDCHGKEHSKHKAAKRYRVSDTGAILPPVKPKNPQP